MRSSTIAELPLSGGSRRRSANFTALRGSCCLVRNADIALRYGRTVGIRCIRASFTNAGERTTTLSLTVPEEQEATDDYDPVDVVRDDRAIGSRVGPPENGIQNAPPTSTVVLRAATLQHCQPKS